MEDVLYPMKFAQFTGNLDHMKYSLRPYKNIGIASNSKKTVVSSQCNTNNDVSSVVNKTDMKMNTENEIKVENQALPDKSIVNQSSSLPHNQNAPCKASSKDSTVMSQKERVNENEQHAEELKNKRLEFPNLTPHNQGKEPSATPKEIPVTSNQSDAMTEEKVSENNKDSDKNKDEQNIKILASNNVESQVKLNATTQNEEMKSDVVKEAAKLNSSNSTDAKKEQETLEAKPKKSEKITHLNTKPLTQEKPNTPVQNPEKSKVQQTQNSQTTETPDVGIGAKIKSFFSRFL